MQFPRCVPDDLRGNLRAFGNLEDHAIGRKTGCLHLVAKSARRERMMGQRVRRHVDEQQGGIWQVRCARQDAVNAEPVQVCYPTKALGDFKRLLGSCESVGRVRAGERLVSQDGLAVDMPDRVKHRFHVALGE